MPVAPPPQTASELLSYHGDAGLAAGANPGGILPQQGDPFGGISNTIDQIHGELMQEKLLDYKQKAQDQENLANMLASTGGSVFNMKDPKSGQNMSFSPLPDDQKVLDQKASDLRDMILKNPDKYMYDRNYLNAKQEYTGLVNHAGVRSAAYSKYSTDAQASQDPDERKDIMAQRDQEVGGHKLTEFHMPEPHLGDIPVADPIDEKDYKDPKTHENFGTAIKTVDGVDYELQKHGIPTSIVYAPMSDFSTKGMINANKYLQQFQKSPVSKDPAYITQMNAAIDKNAESRGTKPVYAATVNPDGTITYNNNPGQVLTALNLEKHGWVQTDTDPSDAALKQQKEAAEAQKDRAEAQKAKQPNAGKPPTAEELKENQEKQTGYNAYKEVKTVFDPTTYTDKEKISTSPLLTGLWGKNKDNIDAVKKAGYSADEYNYYNVPKVAEKYIGLPAPVQTTSTDETITSTKDGVKSNTKTSTKDTTPKGISETADKVIMARDKKTNEGHLLYIKDGAVIANVTEREAIANGLKHESRYDEKVYTNPTTYGQQYYDNGGQGAPAPQSTQTGPPVNLPKLDSKTMEGGKKIGIVGGRRYLITGRTADGQYVGTPL